MEWSPNFIFGKCRIGGLRPRSRAVGVEPNDSVDPGIVFRQPREEMLERVAGADLALADLPRNGDRRLKMKLIHVVRSLVPPRFLL